MRTRSSNNSSSSQPSYNSNTIRRRNRRRRQQQLTPVIVEEEPEIPIMADTRTMAQRLQAPTRGFESEIVIPLIVGDNFEMISHHTRKT